ncbi:hypothetical protein GQX74_010693 [Glossina fuscipes]|nr:hypothetical protein GQX74_010693 [Glossina fuscipes]
MNTKYLIYLTQATESLPEEVLCLALTFKYLLSLTATSQVLIYFMPSELMARACSQMIAFLNAQFILSSLHFVMQSSSSLVYEYIGEEVETVNIFAPDILRDYLIE